MCIWPLLTRLSPTWRLKTQVASTSWSLNPGTVSPTGDSRFRQAEHISFVCERRMTSLQPIWSTSSLAVHDAEELANGCRLPRRTGVSNSSDRKNAPGSIIRSRGVTVTPGQQQIRYQIFKTCKMSKCTTTRPLSDFFTYFECGSHQLVAFLTVRSGHCAVRTLQRSRGWRTDRKDWNTNPRLSSLIRNTLQMSKLFLSCA